MPSADLPDSDAERVGREALKRMANDDDVIKALGCLGTVTYEHRQMVRNGESFALLEMFVTKQRSGDWIFVAVAVAFGANFIAGLFVGQFSWISAAIAAVVALLLLGQRRNAQDVTRQIRQYVHDRGETPSTQESVLASELRLRYPLDYQSRQRLKRGEVIPVARETLTDLRKQRWTQLSAMGLIALSSFLPEASVMTIGSNSSFRDLIPMLISPLMMCGVVWYQWRSIRLSIGRLEELLVEHPTDTLPANPSAETPPDHDSPYRTPTFR